MIDIDKLIGSKLVMYASIALLVMLITFYDEIPLTSSNLFAIALVILIICSIFIQGKEIYIVMLLLFILLASFIQNKGVHINDIKTDI